MKNVQNQLNELYREYLKKLLFNQKLKECLMSDHISSPLFINAETPRAEYLNADLKIIFIGKENNGWFGLNERKENGVFDIFNEEQYLNGLLDLYKRFNLGANYKSPIINFLDLIVAAFRDQKIKTGILWTNLLRIDCGKEWDLKKKTFEIDNNEILRNEIEILKPDVVVFVTGPNYDCFIDWTFKDNKGIVIDDKTISEMCMIEHSELPTKTFRFYHPDYHLRLGSEYRFRLIEEVMKRVL